MLKYTCVTSAFLLILKYCSEGKVTILDKLPWEVPDSPLCSHICNHSLSFEISLPDCLQFLIPLGAASLKVFEWHLRKLLFLCEGSLKNWFQCCSVRRFSQNFPSNGLPIVLRVFADWRMWVYHIWLSYALFIHPSANWNRSLCTKPTFRPAGADTLLVASISTWS